MLALLDTGYSNLKAYSNVLNYLNLNFEIVDNGFELIDHKYEAILLPGVSAFGTLSKELESRGFVGKLKDIAAKGIKIVGTCSGMQILFEASEENPEAKGLGLIQGKVKKFPLMDNSDINIGWAKTKSGEFFFVHGYYCKTDIMLTESVYSNFNGIEFISQFQLDNIYGFQFHPEKSGKKE